MTPWFKSDIDLDGKKDQFYYTAHLTPGVNVESLHAKVDPLYDVELYVKVRKKIEYLGKIREVETIRTTTELLVTKGDKQRKVVCFAVTSGNRTAYWGALIEPSPRLIRVPPEFIIGAIEAS